MDITNIVGSCYKEFINNANKVSRYAVSVGCRLRGRS